jgi:hypothetical protein
VDQKVVLVNGSPEAVKAIQLMYDLYWIKGLGSKRIAYELNKLGIPSAYGKTWSQNCVYNMLMNPIYSQRGICNRITDAEFHVRPAAKGDSPPPVHHYRNRANQRLRANQAKTGNKPKPKCRMFRPFSEWYISVNPEIKILAQEMRDVILEKQLAYQVKTAERDEVVDRRRPLHTSKYLLLGSIFERSTGRRMTAYTCGRNGRHRYYAVSEAWNNPTPETMAKKKFYPADAVEGAVLDILRDVLGNVNEYVPMLKQHATQRTMAQSQDVTDVESLRAQRHILAEKKAFTLDEYGDIGADLLRKRIEPMTAKLQELDRRIQAASLSSGLSMVGSEPTTR